MKQLFRSILSVAAAATLLIGCSKDATETPAPAAGEFTLNLVTGADTRTEIYDPGEGKGVNIKWSEGDVAAIYVNGTLGKDTKSSITDGIITFSSSISPQYMGEGGNQPGIYTAQAVYPAEACTYAKRNADNDAIQAFELNLPAAQEATTASFDKNADILVAKNMDVEITAQDIKDLKKTVENYTFGRTTAITRLNFTVTNDELLNSEETVKSIALTVEGKSLAGTFIFDPAAFKSVKSTTDLTPVEDPNNMFKTGSNKVTVTLTDTPAVNAAFTAWISTAPVSLTNGDKLTFTVTTDAGTTITKTATVGKDLAFMTTRLNTMTVNLNDGVTIDKPVVVEPGAHAVDFIFKDMGYENGADLTTKNVAKDPITIVFAEGSNPNGNKPKYYNSSTAVHTYFGNTFTVSGPEGITIRTIELTFNNPEKYNAEITTNPEGYIETGLWSGSAQKVAFTLSGTSGQRRIASIKVTYDGEAAPVEPVQLATPEVTAEQVPGTTSVKLSWNKVDNATGYEYTIGEVKDITFDTSVTVPLTAGTYDWTVTAVADNNAQYPNSEPATGTITVEEAEPVVGTTKTFTFSEMYSTTTDLTTENVAQHPISIVFAKGSNSSNPPKYYTSGSAVRAYGGNTFTVSGATGITIRTIVLEFGSSDGSNTITTKPGDYNKDTWSGSSQSVTFTIGGSSGNRRIASITVTYEGEAAPIEPVQLATPVVAAEQVLGTTSVKLSWNAVSNANKYIYTFGSQENIETTETAVTIDDLAAGTTYNWTVIAKANDETLYLPSEAATGSITVETPPTGTSDWVEVTDFSTITTGQYIYVVETGGTHYYMKNTQATKAGDVKPGTLTALPTTPGFAAGEDMVLIFTGDQTNGFTIGNASGDYLGATTTNNGVSMKSDNSSTKWVIVYPNEKCNFTIKQTTPNADRYLGLYSTQNYRTYKPESLSNIVDNKTYKLYRYTK